MPNHHELSIEKRAIKAWSGKSSAWERRELGKFCEREGIPVNVPWRRLTEKQQRPHRRR